MRRNTLKIISNLAFIFMTVIAHLTAMASYRYHLCIFPNIFLSPDVILTTFINIDVNVTRFSKFHELYVFVSKGFVLICL